MGRCDTLRLVLGDQLTRSISSLQDIDPQRDVVLMVEVAEEATYVKHHKQKLVFIFSAMRHFAQSLRDEGIAVDYVRLTDAGNSGSFTGELHRAVQRYRPDRVVVTEPGEWRVWQMMQGWQEELSVPVDIREDNRFLCSRREFAQWARGRDTLRLEFFYRTMRQKTGWLMHGNQPEGGRWNYDVENRKPLPAGVHAPSPLRFPPDEMTYEVMEMVNERFAHHFGELKGFGWAVTREQALQALQHFVNHSLPHFGDYQDAMKSGQDFLFHSALSPYINIGLLLPREVCESAIRAYYEGQAPLQSVEGFVRQILGWREYVRGIYWLKMPEYEQTNTFNAHRPLPDFYWTAETDMHCVREVVCATQRNAYAHHIQRLMITGNFALLAGIEPKEVEEWYLLVYADAYEWVELPNTHGMALYADGGLMASKPYAGSGAYINRMSDYCKHCVYDVRQRTGERACPFNFLYWHFLMRNEAILRPNPRMSLPYQLLDRLSEQEKTQIRQQAEQFLSRICPEKTS